MRYRRVLPRNSWITAAFNDIRIPGFAYAEKAGWYLNRYGYAAKPHLKAIRFIVQHLGKKTIPELILPGTAFYVVFDLPVSTPETYIREILELRPGTAWHEAKAALDTVVAWREEAKQLHEPVPLPVSA